MSFPATSLLTAAVTALAVSGAGARADEDQPVVVELFTSQGCASCPPADALMAELAKKEDVLPLALHVDYWDYIGWPDRFADPAFTHRQKAYAKAAGERMIYTPQMIVGGSDRVIGSRAMQVADLIQAHRETPHPVDVDLHRTDRGLRVEATAQAGTPGEMLIQLVTYTPHERVEINGGENAGAVMNYVNIVRDWTVIGHWDGRGTWTSEVPPVEGPGAILVQQPGPGAILGAARID